MTKDLQRIYLREKPRWILRPLLVIVALVMAATSITAQNRTTINIEQQNATLTEILEQVKTQSKLNVIYNDRDVKSVERRQYFIKNATLHQAMSYIVEGTQLEFRVTADAIHIRHNPHKPIAAATLRPAVTVSGQVKATDGSTLAGVAVIIKGTHRAMTTDAQGKFKIDVAEGEEPILAFRVMGMEPAEFAYEGVPMRVLLKPSSTDISDVVVTGIFERKAGSYTGATKSFTKKDIEIAGNQNLIQTLKNLDPSVNVLDNNEFGSDPNRLPDLEMRGTTNFTDMKDRYQTSPNQPLFVVDGFEAEMRKVMDMDMNRVASITILKDATAKALYGSKGANGVIVIETIPPASGKLQVSYTADITLTTPDLSSYNLANAGEKLEIERLAGVYYSKWASQQQQYDAKYYEYLNEVKRGVDTYWLKIPVHSTVGHKHTLFMEGGDEVVRYGVDFAYNKVDGVMRGSGRENISGGFSLQYRLGKFTFKDQLSVNFNKSTSSPYGDYSLYAKQNPYWRSHNEDGTVREILGTYNIANSQGSKYIYNPLINADLNTIDRSSYTDVTNNLYVEWDAFEGMKFKGRLGIVAKRSDSEVFKPRDHTDFRDVGINDDAYFNRGLYTMGNGKDFNWDMDVSANYSKEFAGKHLIFANAQWSTSERSSELIYYQATGFANNKMDYITQAKQYKDAGKPFGFESKPREVSALFSTNYSYDNRYLFDFTFRTTGSSLFGADKRWANFWSVGAGWNLHNEKFIKDINVFDRLRIRASTGYSGSQNFMPHQAIATYTYFNESYDNIIGANLMGLANPFLKPQRTQDNNFGLDISIFNALDITFDYYIKNTTDLLSPVSLPPSSGFESYVENLGKTRNKGFELSLNYRAIKDSERGLYLTVFGSILHNKNKLVKISDSLRSLNDGKNDGKDKQPPNLETDHERNKHVTRPSVLYYEGVSMNAIWAVRSLGISPADGREIFVKKDGTLTYVWDAADQVVCGDTQPKVMGNFGFNFEYKCFSINAIFNYRLGGQFYNRTLIDKVENADIQYNVDRRVLSSRWSIENAGKPARYKDIKLRNSFTRPTSRFVQDFNELQLSSLNIGYDFRDWKFMQQGFIKRLKVQVYSTDLFRISTIKAERGIEYPYARTFSMKIQATF